MTSTQTCRTFSLEPIPPDWGIEEQSTLPMDAAHASRSELQDSLNLEWAQEASGASLQNQGWC